MKDVHLNLDFLIFVGFYKFCYVYQKLIVYVAMMNDHREIANVQEKQTSCITTCRKNNHLHA
jgi:hypothetical protein